MTKIELQFTSPEAEKRYQNSALYGSPMSAGLDLRAAIDKSMSLLPGEQEIIPTGIKLNMAKLSPRIVALALPRSGLGSRDGLVLGNLTGVIDQDYLGEIMLCAWHRPTSGHLNSLGHRLGGNPIHIEPWQKIAQLVFVPVLRFEFDVVQQFSVATERGEGGFGSTGRA